MKRVYIDDFYSSVRFESVSNEKGSYGIICNEKEFEFVKNLNLKPSSFKEVNCQTIETVLMVYRKYLKK